MANATIYRISNSISRLENHINELHRQRASPNQGAQIPPPPPPSPSEPLLPPPPPYCADAPLANPITALESRIEQLAKEVEKMGRDMGGLERRLVDRMEMDMGGLERRLVDRMETGTPGGGRGEGRLVEKTSKTKETRDAKETERDGIIAVIFIFALVIVPYVRRLDSGE
ncbi:hypothetical protein VF21_02414 [Pseudogymnoascus sp. 05NY08]|nr:hypothetical protein VF21_02414 [Pseudogymnoascus sp. 05NY08]